MSSTAKNALTQMEEWVQEAAANAIEEHRRMGRSIVVWQDGRVVRIPPSQLTPRALPGDEKFDDEAAPIS